jgi:hypothetical protein
LLVSQVLTLYTTPVIYLYMDRVSAGWSQLWRRALGRRAPAPTESHAAD